MARDGAARRAPKPVSVRSSCPLPCSAVQCRSAQRSAAAVKHLVVLKIWRCSLIGCMRFGSELMLDWQRPRPLATTGAYATLISRMSCGKPGRRPLISDVKEYTNIATADPALPSCHLQMQRRRAGWVRPGVSSTSSGVTLPLNCFWPLTKLYCTVLSLPLVQCSASYFAQTTDSPTLSA